METSVMVRLFHAPSALPFLFGEAMLFYEVSADVLTWKQWSQLTIMDQNSGKGPGRKWLQADLLVVEATCRRGVVLRFGTYTRTHAHTHLLVFTSHRNLHVWREPFCLVLWQGANFTFLQRIYKQCNQCFLKEQDEFEHWRNIGIQFHSLGAATRTLGILRGS